MYIYIYMYMCVSIYLFIVWGHSPVLFSLILGLCSFGAGRRPSRAEWVAKYGRCLTCSAVRLGGGAASPAPVLVRKQRQRQGVKGHRPLRMARWRSSSTVTMCNLLLKHISTLSMQMVQYIQISKCVYIYIYIYMLEV